MENYKKQLKHIADCIMVDTLGLRVENIPNVNLPKKFSPITGDAEADVNGSWSKGSVKSDCGKHSIRVRGVKKTGEFLVEGSNAVHYQGHNIVSSNDVSMNAYSMLYAVKEKHSFGFKDLWRPWNFLRGWDIEITRIDTPILLKIPDGLQKKGIINALALSGISAGINTSLYVDQTAYFDQHAQDVALKCYDKEAEMKQQRGRKPLPDSPNTAALLELTENTVRFEAVYRKKYFKNRESFKEESVSPDMLTPRVLANMFASLLEQYNLKGDLRQKLKQDDLWAIPRPYRDTVAHWQNGIDLLKMFDGKQATLDVHRRLLKKQYSINISAPPPGEIDVRVDLGEILRVENFVPVPATIRADSALFYQRDMHAENHELCKRMRLLHGIASVYIDPKQLDVEDGGQ